jgi:hypothetical protein
METKDQHLSFAIGTTVRIKRKRSTHNHGKEGIVEDVSVCQGALSYMVSGSAWYDQDELEFISYPTEETLDQVYKMHEEEDEAED